jgi:hypothetical protein
MEKSPSTVIILPPRNTSSAGAFTASERAKSTSAPLPHAITVSKQTIMPMCLQKFFTSISEAQTNFTRPLLLRAQNVCFRTGSPAVALSQALKLYL